MAAGVENTQKWGFGNKWPLMIITTNEDPWIGVEMLGYWQIQPVHFQLDWLVWYNTFHHVNTYPHKNLQTSRLASVSQYFSHRCLAKRSINLSECWHSRRWYHLHRCENQRSTVGGALQNSHQICSDWFQKASWSQYGIAWTRYTAKQTKGFLFYVASRYDIWQHSLVYSCKPLLLSPHTYLSFAVTACKNSDQII